MRHVDNGHAAPLEAIDGLEEPVDLVRRQRRRRLVHDDQPGLERQRLRDLDHLLLRDSEVLDHRFGIDVQVQRREHVARLADQLSAIDDGERTNP